MSAHSNAIGSRAAPAALARPKVYLAVLLALGLSHLLNDAIQSLIPAIYPILKNQLALDFVQIGMITLTFQTAGALFQPVIGLYTDRHPLPYSAVAGMVFSLLGIVSLACASSYGLILVSVTFVGIGSSIFHPDATRSARYASGGRHGLAQGIFQVGDRSAVRSVRYSPPSSSCPVGSKALRGSHQWRFSPWRCWPGPPDNRRSFGRSS